VAVTGPGGCRWQFSRGEDGVHRSQAAADCPARAFDISLGARGARFAGRLMFENPAPPDPQVAFNAEAAWIEWIGNNGLIAAAFSSEFSLPGSIFSGETSVRELSCRVSGFSGEAVIPADDLAWAHGLPERRPAVFRHEWAASVSSGSWGSPTEAVYVREFRAREIRPSVFTSRGVRSTAR
jgi:hypothetical protein